MPWLIAAQLVGAFTGVAGAHVMFGEPLFSMSQHARSGGAQAFSEFVATFGLLLVIWGFRQSPWRARSPTPSPESGSLMPRLDQ